jgi:hypothetical protein
MDGHMIGLALLKYAQPVGLVAALGFGALEWHAHNSAERDRGIALERARVADSLLSVNAIQIARVDTVYRRDTIRLARFVARTDTLRDSLLVHLTDTVRVKEFVVATDSSLKACQETANDCAQFRHLALQRFAAYENKLAAIPQAKPQRHLASDLLWFTLGVAGGYVAHR